MNKIVLGLIAGGVVYAITKKNEIVAAITATPTPVVVPVVPQPSGVVVPSGTIIPIVNPPIVNIPPIVVPTPIVTPTGNIPGLLWEEDWEDTISTYLLNTTWGDTSCTGMGVVTGNPRVVTDRPYSGTRSLRFVYAGHQQAHIDNGARVSIYHLPEWPKSPQGQCNNHRYFVPQDEIWLRWMEYIEPGFQVDEIGTKSIQLIYSKSYGGYDAYSWFSYMWGADPPTYGRRLDISQLPDGVELGKNYYQNMEEFVMPDGQWVCYEAHLKLNLPGQSDGMFELFVTPMNTRRTQQATGYYNKMFRGGTTFLTNDMKIGGLGMYVQDGMGTIYRDRIAVGTQRIGIPS